MTNRQARMSRRATLHANSCTSTYLYRWQLLLLLCCSCMPAQQLQVDAQLLLLLPLAVRGSAPHTKLSHHTTLCQASQAGMTGCQQHCQHLTSSNRQHNQGDTHTSADPMPSEQVTMYMPDFRQTQALLERLGIIAWPALRCQRQGRHSCRSNW